MHYTDNQLCKMLEDVDADLSHSDLTHLEDCEVCRSRLAALSGEGAWLDDWLDSVGEVTCHHLDTPNLQSNSTSVVIAVDSSAGMNDGLQCESVRLDFLDMPTHPELLGRLGRYDIERLIGMGGYGIVFKARDSELNRVVAIKVLAPHLMNSGPARKRFAREAQASAAVVHDHVVPIYDVVADANICYFVMQYIAGESLQERVDRKGPLSTEDVLRISAQTAAGLHAAHEQGLIHRDVKPGNVLLEDSVNRVMISDFGLARASDDASLTRSGTITGTPHYMSPEQARGQAVDARSDLFSLGSVIYFMCTGRSPFRAAQMMAVLNRICHEAYRPIEEINPNVPYELTKIVDRLLSKKPERRFETADEVHTHLQQLLSDYQSGKLRPRRFHPPRALKSPKNLAIAGSLLAVAVVAIAAVYSAGLGQWTNVATVPAMPAGPAATPALPTEVTERVEIKTFASDSELLPESLPATSASSLSVEMAAVGSLGGEALGEELNATTVAIESLERASVRVETLDASLARWDQEIFSIHAALSNLERELAADDLQSSADD